MKTYTPRELMRGAEITVGVYNQWLFRDLFTATVRAQGAGTISAYSLDDILTVSLIVKMSSLGIRLKTAKEMANAIIEYCNSVLPGGLFAEPYLVLVVTLDQQGVPCVEKYLEGTQGVILGVEQLMQNILRNIEE